jgi:uncharacterized protein DUF2752
VTRAAPPVHPGAGHAGGAQPGASHADASRTRALLVEAAAPLGLLVLAAALPPDRPIPFDLCLWHRLTGHPCLGCGLTRSICHLMHGDVGGSLALHPLGVAAAALMVALAARGTARLLRRRG